MSSISEPEACIQYTVPPEDHFRAITEQLECHEDHFTLVEFLKVCARIQVKQRNSVDTPQKSGYSQDNSMW